MDRRIEGLNADPLYVITAGSTYLDIDAYACCVAMAELLTLQGKQAIAYSNAPCNYSVCQSLAADNQIAHCLPNDCQSEGIRYIIVDVSDPGFLKDSIPLEQVVAVYDHHVGFEQYWQDRIGEKAKIEFVGAAATLIVREWIKVGLLDKMSRSAALLLLAAILDNTLNLTSANTTQEDIAVFDTLCKKECVGEEWVAAYFSEVQSGVEADLKNALFNDIKTIAETDVLPPKIGQLCVWNAERVLKRLAEIRQWFSDFSDSWLLNIIDISRRCSYFVCDDPIYQAKIQESFPIAFKLGIGRLPTSYLRKEIIKRTKANRQ